MLFECECFEWDEGNSLKYWEKHKISMGECEQCFFNSPMILLPPSSDGVDTIRYALLSKSDQDCLLTIVFVVRHKKIRVISARDMSRKERKLYDKENSKN